MMRTNCKVIYSKRIKELLEDDYGIYPIGRTENPRNKHYIAWVFKRTDALLLAIKEIMDSQGDNAYGNQDKNK